LAIRMPDGARVVRRFADARSLTALYAFVDAQLADGQGEETSPAGHGKEQVEHAMEEQIGEAGTADAWWGFQLVLAYPRQEIPWARGTTVGGVECLKGGAQLVVHMLAPTHAATGEEDDDGYVSEE